MTGRRILSMLLVVALCSAYTFVQAPAASAASDFDTAKAEYLAAVQAEKDAKADYDNAQTEYDAAVSDNDAAVRAVNAAQDDLDLANDEVDRIIGSIKTNAQTELDSKQTAYGNAETALDSAKTATQTARTEYEAALASYDEEALNQAVTDAENNVAAAETALADANTAKDLAQQKFDNIGREFINEKAGQDLSIEGLTELYKQIDSLTAYAGTTNYENALSSALTVDNLKKAADFVDECNELRARHDLSALKINYRLMCLSLTSAAVSNSIDEHAVIQEIYNSNSDPSNPLAALTSNGVIPRYPSENLAWGYSDPFSGWYTYEKAKYEEYVASGDYPGMEDMTAYELQNNYYEVYKKTGHYLNIIDPSMKITGYANNAGSTDEQSFASSEGYGENVTPEQFRQALTSYAESAETELETAKTNVTTATNALTQANTELTSAETERDTAKANVTAKKGIYDAAVIDEENAQIAFDTAESDLADARTAKQKADAIDMDDEDSYKDYPDLVTAAEDVKTAESTLQTKQGEADTAAGILTEKETALDTAKGVYLAAVQTTQTAEAAFEAAKPDLSKASVNGLKSVTYTGKAITQNITVVLDGETVAAQNYSVKYSSNTNAGTARITITGKGDYKGAVTKTFTIAKAAQKMTVKAAVKNVKYKKLKKKKQIVSKVFTVKNARGTVSYKTVKFANSKAKKALSLNRKNGKITVKKGTKKGKYKMTVAVTAKGDGNFKAVTKKVTVTVRVR